MKKLVLTACLLGVVLGATVHASAQQGFGPTGAPKPGEPPKLPKKFTGVSLDKVYHQGKVVGAVDERQINCLGHASGVGSAVFVGTYPLSETLGGLGYSCRVGDHASLAADLAAGRDVMMVYLHMYPPEWRDPLDANLSFPELIKKYRWNQDSWKKPFVFYDEAGRSAPIDYHAVGYSRAAGRWEWVAQVKAKDRAGSYATDSVTTAAAAQDPDVYFPAERVLVSLACGR